MLSISCPTINLQDTFLVLGEKRFHYIWLRDHCLCPKCYDPSSRQKISNFSDLTHDIQPFSVQCQDNQLLINWNELSEHQSIFPMSWLLDHAYDPTPKPELSSQRILWDRGGLEAQKITWPDYCADTQKTWRDLLDKLGFVVLRNVSLENLESLLLSIGPIYEFAKFGNFSTVKPVPTSSNLSSDLSVMVQYHGILQSDTYIHQVALEQNKGEQIEKHPAFEQTIRFCKMWDQISFAPNYDTLPLSVFVPMLESVFGQKVKCLS